MLLWTIQSERAYEIARSKGILRADWEHIFFDENPEAYLWMADRLEEKSRRPSESIRTPVWAWFQWEGKRKRRDLRCSGYSERGKSMVQLTIEVPDQRVLLSDFDYFHMVLMNMYVPVSEEDDKNFDKEIEGTGLSYNDLFQEIGDLEMKFIFRNKIIQSWNRIFDLENVATGYNSSIGQSIQAVMWEVHLDEIKKVERFIAR